MSARISPRRTGLPRTRQNHTASSDLGIPHARVAEIQRARLLVAAGEVVAEVGYLDATVARITRRARVSRRTFYELFANAEECVATVLEEYIAQIATDLQREDIEGLPWRERIRTGLSAILTIFDRDPILARVCVVESARGGPAVLERREQILGRLAEAIDEGRHETARAGGCTKLTAEGLAGAAFAIVQARLQRRQREPLSELAGELAGLIVLPYLGPAAARREQERSAPESAHAPVPRVEPRVAKPTGDPLEGLPMRLTYRTARVLEGIDAHPGASNRMVADHAEIADQGQVSKLLARLERLGLVANDGQGRVKGEPNAWTLTAKGERVAQSVCLPQGEEQVAV
jgi:AcrR family transcriptional regulator